jgi:putative peptide zinc metalloprotease protein
MSATADRSTVARADGLSLLGDVPGSGYENGASLVRRADGQMVQLGPLTYALLEEADGTRDCGQLAAALTERLGRTCDEQHVVAIAQKLAAQGLLAGTEANAPERSNPLLALRWKVVVTDPVVTRRLTAPFLVLFRPWVAVPVLAAFLAVCWFVLVEKGVAAAAADAFAKPELILLVFGLAVASAAFHELGHASACRYGGGTPGAMGAGVYLVWPAFYTDVTDAYRLPRRDRLRTDLGGLYFNSIVAVATLGAWYALRIDALLLLIGLQLLEMVKQLSPVIRADGYHILSDATGVPDLYAHIGPTLSRLVPGRRREPSALTGRARLLVTLWVLVIVPVLLATALTAVLLLPKVVASAWESGSALTSAMPEQAGDGDLVELLVSALRLVSLTLPVLGVTYIAWRLARGAASRAASWSGGRTGRRLVVAAVTVAAACALAWAWWPAGQYEPIRASDRGTLVDAGRLVASPASSSSPTEPAASAATAPAPEVPPGTYVAVSLIPEGGATEDDPAVFVITDPAGDRAPVLIATTSTPPEAAPTDAQPSTDADAPTTPAAAFSFGLPDAPGEDDSQALAVNRTDGGTTYSIAYSLVTVRDGDPVDPRNGAHAFANCHACTTVAVSFQVVLVVGTSQLVTPVNIAEALNGNCPQCVTTAIANQIVVSIGEEPSAELLTELNAELERLDSLDELGDEETPDQIATQVTDVQRSINQILVDSGLVPTTDSDTAEPASTETDADAAQTTTEPAPDSSEPPTDTEDPATSDPSTAPAPEPAPERTTNDPQPGPAPTTPTTSTP